MISGDRKLRFQRPVRYRLKGLDLVVAMAAEEEQEQEQEGQGRWQRWR